ncbi:hypothetical protein [Chitinophaga filiformis]|uniref:Peptide modification target, TIGR04139 family n=1 Tax=Chitinophaga filiformis TaxID=104663 RepID=A0ABY4I8A5_CHIFI|nr:hypothetical protein [Chitinophaga filiformis]UPK72102.1 hypothetical protein MYF79_12485 [Chitinophaga filiformis]
MKKLKDLFTKNTTPALEQCTAFAIKNEESDTVYGGFKEYKPPIYEQDDTTNCSYKTNDLLIDINQTK